MSDKLLPGKKQQTWCQRVSAVRGFMRDFTSHNSKTAQIQIPQSSSLLPELKLGSLIYPIDTGVLGLKTTPSGKNTAPQPDKKTPLREIDYQDSKRSDFEPRLAPFKAGKFHNRPLPGKETKGLASVKPQSAQEEKTISLKDIIERYVDSELNSRPERAEGEGHSRRSLAISAKSQRQKTGRVLKENAFPVPEIIKGFTSYINRRRPVGNNRQEINQRSILLEALNRKIGGGAAKSSVMVDEGRSQGIEIMTHPALAQEIAAFLKKDSPSLLDDILTKQTSSGEKPREDSVLPRYKDIVQSRNSAGMMGEDKTEVKGVSPDYVRPALIKSGVERSAPGVEPPLTLKSLYQQAKKAAGERDVVQEEKWQEREVDLLIAAQQGERDGNNRGGQVSMTHILKRLERRSVPLSAAPASVSDLPGVTAAGDEPRPDAKIKILKPEFSRFEDEEELTERLTAILRRQARRRGVLLQ